MGRGGLHLRNRVPLERAPGDAPEIPPVRVAALAALTALGLLVVIFRFWYLQVAQGQRYLDSAYANQRTSVRIAPPRGIIEDRNGVALLTNTARIDVFDPPTQQRDWVEKEVRRQKKSRKGHRWKQAEIDELYKAVRFDAFVHLSGILGTDPAEMLKEFEKNRTTSSEPALVQRGISQDQLAQVAERLSELPGVLPMVVPVRLYPKGALGAQILGYIDQITADKLKREDSARVAARDAGQDDSLLPRHRSGDQIGTYGLEKYYDQLLSGTEGSIDYAVNNAQERQGVLEERPAVPGAKLTLTLDWRLQALAEKLMQGKKGAAVALDPRDGSVLAMASFPSFDPNAFQHRPISKATMDAISAGQLNRAVDGIYPPGSTFKIISSVAGLAEKKITTGTVFSCGGSYLKLNCDGTHGGVALRGALTVSCDTYYYHVGQRLGEEKLKTWAQNFGLGVSTGIDLPGKSFGEPEGHLSTSKCKNDTNENLLEKARKAANQEEIAKLEREPKFLTLGETMQTAIGQGFTAISPLHMAQVAAAVASRGKIYKPHFLKKATVSDGSNKILDIDEAKPRITNEIKLPKDQWDVIQQGLRAVVTSGTAQKTANSPFVYISGKTGTAEKNKSGDNVAWFICYASKKAGETPSIAVAVCVEPMVKGQHGADMAGPIARKLVEGHFGVGLTDTKPIKLPLASTSGD